MRFAAVIMAALAIILSGCNKGSSQAPQAGSSCGPNPNDQGGVQNKDCGDSK
jgi:hypothetical protein